MKSFSVHLNKNQRIEIDKKVFISLLDMSHIVEYKDYTDAIESSKITFENLKKLANKASVPYPLFFAPKEIVDIQLKDKDKKIFEKIPGKDEIRLSSRGRVEVKDIELIVKDLGRKQEFLKTRVLPTASPNNFIGSVSRQIKSNVDIQTIGAKIREYLGIDLLYLRSIPKNKVLSYITSCAEEKGILISFSSYNYMPQNIDPELELSGICIKDKKFPYVFINTRDGDEKPKILESTGRQIFTLLSMLSCIAMGHFVLSSKAGSSKNDPAKIAYSLASEILIPKKDILVVKISTLDELKEKAHFFRVTPSMLLYHLQKNRRIQVGFASSFRKQLQQEVTKAEPKQRHAPLPINAYGKYNGERFSKEIIRAYNSDLISQQEVKNILFRKGKMEAELLKDYSRKFQ